MPHMSAVYLCLAVAVLALAGCAPSPYWTTAGYCYYLPDYTPVEPVTYPITGVHCFPQQPPDYSPDYAYIPVVAPNGRTRMVLVPKACMVPDPTHLPHLGPHLPPGCANAWNLLRIAERKGDLLHGRPLSAAPAAPTARAAHEYIYGTKDALGGGLPRVPGSPAPGPGSETQTQTQAPTETPPAAR